MQGLQRIAKGLLRAGVSLIPARALQRLMYRLVVAKIASLSPIEALRFLFNLDQDLYSLQGQAALNYGNGLHPKHRLTGYHGFFVKHVRAGESVLDIGCGNGALAYSVVTRGGATVTGIDQDARSIESARSFYRDPRLRFVVGDARVSLPEGRYDVVMLSNILEHIEDRVTFLRRVRETVKPERWLVRVPLFERDWRVPLKKEIGVDYRLDRTHFIEYPIEEFHSELRSGGLEVIHSEVRWGEIWVVAESRHSVPGCSPDTSR